MFIHNHYVGFNDAKWNKYWKEIQGQAKVSSLVTEGSWRASRRFSIYYFQVGRWTIDS